jgi:hypothetical protein
MSVWLFGGNASWKEFLETKFFCCVSFEKLILNKKILFIEQGSNPYIFLTVNQSFYPPLQ